MDTIAELSNTQTALITTEDAALLRSARETLNRLAEDAQTAGFDAIKSNARGSEVNAMDYGRMTTLANVACDAIFDFLNTARHHCDQLNVDFQMDRP